MRSNNLFKHGASVLILALFVLLALGSGSTKKAVKETSKKPEPAAQTAVRENTVPAQALELHDRGLALFNEKQYDQAITEYTEAIKLYPQYAGRGHAYNGKKDYDRAIADYSQALRIDPDHALSKDNLELARVRASYNPAQFTLLPSDFNPADYQKRDLFDAVASAEKMSQGSGSLFDGMLTTFRFVSDVVFVSQNGTDIFFKTADNAISQHMKIGSRSGLSPGQKVRIYCTVSRNPYTEWNVNAIEKL
jgi:tetratricopeptide (TPR) repeat protein